MDKDVYTFNEITGQVVDKIFLNGMFVFICVQVEILTPGMNNENGSISPTSSPTILLSSGRKNNFVKSFSTGEFIDLRKKYSLFISDSAFNHLGDDIHNGDSREPSPTKSISPYPKEEEDQEIESRPISPGLAETDPTTNV